MCRVYWVGPRGNINDVTRLVYILFILTYTGVLTCTRVMTVTDHFASKHLLLFDFAGQYCRLSGSPLVFCINFKAPFNPSALRTFVVMMMGASEAYKWIHSCSRQAVFTQLISFLHKTEITQSNTMLDYVRFFVVKGCFDLQRSVVLIISSAYRNIRIQIFCFLGTRYWNSHKQHPDGKTGAKGPIPVSILKLRLS